MKTDELEYELPERFIAQRPLASRDDSRLLVLDRHDGDVTHATFRDLPEMLGPPSLLVVNDTRVFPARLVGKRQTGGRAELLLLRPDESGAGGLRWRCLGRPRKKLRAGVELDFGEIRATVVDGRGDELVVDLTCERALSDALEDVGHIPLPPYIRRADEAEDWARYQTIFARDRAGSVAAPTAGLHFTNAVLEALEAADHRMTSVTLHVGPGTFLPVRADDLADHDMHAEWYDVSDEAAREISEARSAGRRIVAVGTTVVRTLESAVNDSGDIMAGRGMTKLFIVPGHSFRLVEGLVTNFHLPRSTLLALVCAFAGQEPVLSAYREAVCEGYRFYSYGDAMLIR